MRETVEAETQSWIATRTISAPRGNSQSGRWRESDCGGGYSVDDAVLPEPYAQCINIINSPVSMRIMQREMQTTSPNAARNRRRIAHLQEQERKALQSRQLILNRPTRRAKQNAA